MVTKNTRSPKRCLHPTKRRHLRRHLNCDRAANRRQRRGRAFSQQQFFLHPRDRFSETRRGDRLDDVVHRADIKGGHSEVVERGDEHGRIAVQLSAETCCLQHFDATELPAS